jgi:hypothetical protein
MTAQRELVERVVFSSPDCVKILDPGARLLDMNESGMKALCIRAFADVAGADWRTFWSGADRAAAEVAIDVARAGGVGHFVGRYDVEGEPRWWDVTVTPMPSDAPDDRLLAISRDITSARMSYLRERELAMRMQAAALPTIPPRIGRLTLSAVYRASEADATIGGDWFDAFPLSDGRIAMTVGDVVGHGIDAAVAMTKLRLSMRAAALAVPHCATMLDIADQTLRMETTELYATALAAIYDPWSSSLTLASAGHPGPLIRYPDGRIEDATMNMPLLGLGAQNASVRYVDLDAGSIVVFFTDGILEVERDLTRGFALMRDAVARLGAARDASIAGDVIAQLLGDRAASDDVAVLAAAVGPA